MANYKICKECRAELMADDIAIFRKLIMRNAEEFLCIDCLASRFECTRADIERLIQHYRDSGECTLFR